MSFSKTKESRFLFQREIRQVTQPLVHTGRCLPRGPCLQFPYVLIGIEIMKTIQTQSVLAIAIAITAITTSLRAADPLPSWNETDAKRAIIKFVENVKTEG